MNIIIVNQPLRNRGDESAHRALIRKLLQDVPKVSITVLNIEKWHSNYSAEDVTPFIVDSSNVEYITTRINHTGLQSLVSYAIRWHFLSFLLRLHPGFQQLARYYKKADFVLCAPGGICLGGFQNWSHLTMLYFAKILKKKILYFGRSIGPFPEVTSSNVIFKKGAIELLRYVSFLSLRDTKSLTIAKELGVECIQTVDTAFLDSPLVSIPGEVKELIGDNQYVVMVPNLLVWHSHYKGRISKENVVKFYVKLIKILFNKYSDAKIVMLPQTYGNKSDVATWNDYIFMNELKNAYNDERIIVLPDCYSSDVQQKIISGALFLTGARYHSIVFAVNNMIPFISLSYEHKMSGMLEVLGGSEYVVDISDNQLETETELDKTVLLFEKKLQNITFDESVYIKAKQKSEDGFAIMLDVINRNNE